MFQSNIYYPDKPDRVSIFPGAQTISFFFTNIINKKCLLID